MYSFGERILPDYDTRDIGLSNMVQPMKLRCCVFNKIFLIVLVVNQWRDILNFNCKWLCYSKSESCRGPKPGPLLN